MRERPSAETIQKILGRFKDKVTTAEEAVSVVKSGDKVFVGTACATPQTLIMALERTNKKLSDVQLFQLFDRWCHTQEGWSPLYTVPSQVIFRGH